ncbi:hypothetical protein PTTG_05237 [Puccinia triticina 1-1 BBBD Race 1]|uniref:Uncharacterized protein n=2 Tax=Puccinia triticina TaxID=208348 RepID=A0A180G1C0_PUCT1|nr:hypothetical protein PTTG_05237 [Puccinia triticina 1-1 BBBD Race 1]
MNQLFRRTLLVGLTRRKPPRLNHAYSTGPNSKRTAAGAGLILGIPLTAYLIYRANTQPAYPDEIQRLLRQALIAEHRSDHRKSDILFRQAYEQSKQLVRSGELDWLKSSAVAIRWAASLEQTARTDRAIEVYQLVFDDLRLALPGLSVHERLRTIEIAQKLGQLLIHHSPTPPGKPAESVEIKIEECLVFSVEEILKIRNENNNFALDSDERQQMLPVSDQYQELFESLPSWVARLQFASCFEALGKFYAQRGQTDFALPLYLQTLNLLLPPQQDSGKKWNKQGPTDEERCQAATVMNNIGQLLFAHSVTDAGAADGGSDRLRLNAADWLGQSAALARRVLDAHQQLPALDQPRPLDTPPNGFLAECQEAFVAASANLKSLNHPPTYACLFTFNRVP